MNDQYALDPAIARRIAELRLLLSKFGVYEGRFISRFPAGWVKRAFDGLDDQSARKRLEVLLDRCKREAVFLPSNRAYDSERPWVENAAEQHDKAPFAGVISTEARPGFMVIDEVDPTSFPASRDMSVTGSLENMMRAIRPLLEMSGSLYLIDPYFKPWKPETRELLGAVLTEKKLSAKFVAFVSASKDWPDFTYADKQIRGALPANFPCNRTFEVSVCDDEDAESRMHARYLFSEIGGIRLDRGLRTDKAMVDLSFIDKGVHADLWHRFVERNRYRVMHKSIH